MTIIRNIKNKKVQKGEIMMLLTGNTYIQGKHIDGLKLMEEVLEFDLILFSPTSLAADGASVIARARQLLAKNGMIGMKNSKSISTLLLNHLLVGNKLKQVKDTNGLEEEWTIFQEAGTEGTSKKSMESYIKAASSVLIIGEDIECTATEVLNMNEADKQNRTFVILNHNKEDIAFDEITKQSFIYDTKLERILLDYPMFSAAV